MARRLRRKRFDLAVLFPNSFRTAAIAAMGGAKRIAGYARDGRGCGANWRNNYRLGVIDTLRAKLAEGAARTAQQARSDYAHNPAALVRVEQALVSRRVAYAEVSTWVERNMHMRTANWSSRPANWQAREAGRKAGHEITINAAKGALGGK